MGTAPIRKPWMAKKLDAQIRTSIFSAEHFFAMWTDECDQERAYVNNVIIAATARLVMFQVMAILARTASVLARAACCV